MRSLLTIFAFIALTFFCWGIYGPVLHEGQTGMHHSSLRPLICVGVAYFLIAVVVPIGWLQSRGEKGHWTANGTIWSFAAGAVGALGALGIILAFKFRGNPVYVMPLVFGLAPVINTFVTMWMTKNHQKPSLAFFLGLVLVAVGAAGVMWFKPNPQNVVISEPTAGGPITITRTKLGGAKEEKWTAANLDQLKNDKQLDEAFRLYNRFKPLQLSETAMVFLSIALTAFSWGSYGPVLHRGQMQMGGSRLRPLLMVGLAYFAIAVVVPGLVLLTWAEPGDWTFSGTAWSLAAGAAGAVGALGIIMAFNFGGKPIYVMPLVFGCAPIVNTITTMAKQETFAYLTPAFYAALVLTIAGAVTVLVFAPKAQHGPPAKGGEPNAKSKHEREPATTNS